MDSIEQAAAAFDADMSGGRSAAKPGKAANGEVAKAPEPIFNNLGELDDDSPELSEDDKKFLAEKGKKAKKPKASEDPDEDDLSDAFKADDPDFDEDGEKDEDPDEDDPDGEKDEEEGDEDDEDDELMSQEFEVMVDGEEKKVTLKEALEGYIRTETFHTRLNKLAEAKNQLVEYATQLSEDRKKVSEMMEEAEEFIKAITPEEPNWDELFEKDPKAARELQKTYTAFNKQLEEIRAKRKAMAEEEATKAAKETAEFARREYVKFANYARWQNKDDQAKDLKSMRRTGLAAGFSEEEIAKVYDSRMLTILLKASKFDRIMAARPKALKKGKTPVSPGAGSKGTARRGIAAAQKQLARTGSVEDAAPVFERIIRGR